MRPIHLLLAVLPAAALGCHDGGMAVPDSIGATYDCAADNRWTPYTPGLEIKGRAGMLDFKLMTADPAPPARGDNTWQIEVSAMAQGIVGSTVAGATVEATPYMPDHGHGSPIVVQVTDDGNGDYELTPVNLWMPGYWETTISVQSDAGNDAAVYKFCLPD